MKELKILIVEDNPTIGAELLGIITPFYPHTTWVENGAKGWERFREERHEIVLSDIKMPQLSGVELARRIRRSHPKTVLFLCSGAAEGALLEEAIRIGVNDFFLKPIDPKELLGRLHEQARRLRVDEELAATRALLVQYKETVDEAFLVSKTDKRGIITYANPAFCAISGYSYEELVGHPHSIIRHPEMDRSIFTQMWREILSGKVWKGVVKNRRKDGSHYIVDTIIQPIVDEEGEIVEFIAMRSEITEQYEYRELLQRRLGETKKDLAGNLHRMRQHEFALDSLMVSWRSTPEGILTNANTHFRRLSGKSLDELSGMRARSLLSFTHEGGVRLCTLSTKEGTRYLSGVEVPIYGLDGSLEEMLGIAQDVTEEVVLRQERDSSYKEISYKLGELAELRSAETGQHVRRVAHYAELLARACGLPEEECALIKLAAPMHDIGKIGIPDAVLNKPGPLDEGELAVMRTHATIGYELFRHSRHALLQTAAIIAHEHHEQWDGGGYPRRLKGGSIHLYGRITAIADVFDALGCARVYKPAWELERIFAFLLEQSGLKFDPELVALFLQHEEEINTIRTTLSDGVRPE